MSAPALHMLLIGIDTYAPNCSVSSLRGCVNDVIAMRNWVLARNPAAHSVLLLNDNATRTNLVREMSRLRESVQNGDVVWIHYSGHGSSVPSATADSGSDESLVLWESRTPGGSDLRDKEFGRLLGAIAAKGAQVITILDCCYAGGQTRRAEVAAVRACPPDTRVYPVETESENSVSVPANALDSVTTLFACRDDEKAAEMLAEGGDSPQWHGAATWFLLRALDEFTPELTWSQVQDRMSAGVRSRYARQSPQLAGPGERRIFGGAGMAHTPSVPVLALAEKDGKQRVQFGGGLALGIGAGARLAILAGDEGQITQPIATAIVESAEAETSWAVVLGAPNAEIAPGSPARVVAYGYESARLKVSVSAAPLLDALQRSPLALVEVVDLVEAEVVVEENQDAYLLRDSAGEPLLNREFAATSEGVDLLLRALGQIAVYRNVQRLRNRAVSAALQHVLTIDDPLALSNSRGTLIAFGESKPLVRSGGGGWIAPSGKTVGVAITNQSSNKCYVAVLALKPDWSIVPIEPRGSGQTTLAAGKTLRVTLAMPAPSSSNRSEVLIKIFITTTPIDFSSLHLHPLLEKPQKEPTRNASSLGWLLDAVRRTGTRPVRPALTENADDKWYVYDLALRLEPLR